MILTIHGIGKLLVPMWLKEMILALNEENSTGLDFERWDENNLPSWRNLRFMDRGEDGSMVIREIFLFHSCIIIVR